MRSLHRRSFLATSAALAAAPLVPGLAFLAPLSRQAAASTKIEPDPTRADAGLESLVKLIRSTPRTRCIPVFIEQLKAGLSYQDFLSALFLATVEHGDPHQVAGVYSAHRISSEARTEERLLPLFWALDRIARGFEEEDRKPPGALTGDLPPAAEAADVLRAAMAGLDPDKAERAIAVLGLSRGGRQAMSLLWEHGARRTQGTLGHHPIMTANTWRTLEALGWQHAEPVLRYLARSFATNDSDRTFLPNQERARRALTALPAGWVANEPHRAATVELFQLLRGGSTDAACDLVCAQLASGVRAGALWDAVHLVAADLLHRHRTGGGVIGGYLIHCVTSTNALRCGFDACPEDRVRLFLLLQAVAVLGDLFVDTARREDQLRDRSLLDLRLDGGRPGGALADIFAMLPVKFHAPGTQQPVAERQMSDDASRVAFALLQSPADQAAFRQLARGYLCAKATDNAHDFKYPVAAFEDARLVNAEWRPYLLASSLHALHGPRSEDAAPLRQTREALK